MKRGPSGVKVTVTWRSGGFSFFECDAVIDRALADGLNAGDVYDRAVAQFNEAISDMEDAGHDYVAAVLEYDRDHLMAPSVDPRWGDPEAVLV